MTALAKKIFELFGKPELAAERPPKERTTEAQRPVSIVRPARGVDAMTWLHAKLATPQRIAPVIAEWVGPLDRPTGRNLDDLMNARWTLGVHAYIGEDERFWWRLPQETVQ